MKDREYSMDKGKSKHQEEDEDSGKKSPFYSRDICGGSMMENQGLGNEKQGIKPALQDSKRPKELDLGYETLVETTVSDPPPHENSDNFFAWDYRGVASTMMEKMQYRKGEGLGKNKQGIKHPLQPTNRPQSLKLGLGYQNYDLVNTTVSDPPPNENSWDYIQRLKDDEENMVRAFKEAAAKVTLPRPATKFTLSRVPSEKRRNPLPFQVIIKPKRKTISTEDSPEPTLPPPPPPVEVLSSEASSSVEVDKVSIGEITLLKGRVSTKEVFGLPNSDLVPGVYEGVLASTLVSEVTDGSSNVREVWKLSYK